MLRLQPTRHCNLNCSYCYIPASLRRKTDRMSAEVLSNTLRKLRLENLLGDHLNISWHGAEPLAAGLEWYRSAMPIISAELSDVCSVSHIFQSNGVLIDEEWCRFFKEIGATVGLSIDGAESQNTARVNWGGRPAHKQAMRGARLLNDQGIPWTLLTVVTQKVMDDPASFISFVESSGCTNFGFKVEETNVDNISSLDQVGAAGDIEAAYANFVESLWRAFPQGGDIRVREFEDYRSLRRAGESRRVVPVTLIPFRNLTVGVDGSFTIFAGELLFQEDDRYAFGNVLDGPLKDCLKSDKFRSMSAEMVRGARRCAVSCRHFRECGSFYVSQKIAEHGRADALDTLACRLEISTMFDRLDAVNGQAAVATARH